MTTTLERTIENPAVIDTLTGSETLSGQELRAKLRDKLKAEIETSVKLGVGKHTAEFMWISLYCDGEERIGKEKAAVLRQFLTEEDRSFIQMMNGTVYSTLTSAWLALPDPLKAAEHPGYIIRTGPYDLSDEASKLADIAYREWRAGNHSILWNSDWLREEPPVVEEVSIDQEVVEEVDQVVTAESPMVETEENLEEAVVAETELAEQNEPYPLPLKATHFRGLSTTEFEKLMGEAGVLKPLQEMLLDAHALGKLDEWVTEKQRKLMMHYLTMLLSCQQLVPYSDYKQNDKARESVRTAIQTGILRIWAEMEKLYPGKYAPKQVRLIKDKESRGQSLKNGAVPVVIRPVAMSLEDSVTGIKSDLEALTIQIRNLPRSSSTLVNSTPPTGHTEPTAPLTPTSTFKFTSSPGFISPFEIIVLANYVLKRDQQVVEALEEVSRLWADWKRVKPRNTWVDVGGRNRVDNTADYATTADEYAEKLAIAKSHAYRLFWKHLEDGIYRLYKEPFGKYEKAA